VLKVIYSAFHHFAPIILSASASIPSSISSSDLLQSITSLKLSLD
jgi:hypothetical protein